MSERGISSACDSAGRARQRDARVVSRHHRRPDPIRLDSFGGASSGREPRPDQAPPVGRLLLEPGAKSQPRRCEGRRRPGRHIFGCAAHANQTRRDVESAGSLDGPAGADANGAGPDPERLGDAEIKRRGPPPPSSCPGSGRVQPSMGKRIRDIASGHAVAVISNGALKSTVGLPRARLNASSHSSSVATRR